MSAALPWLLLVALVVHLGAHATIIARLARAGAWGRAAIGLVVSPLALWWGLEASMKRAAAAWIAGLALYAAGVILAALA